MSGFSVEPFSLDLAEPLASATGTITSRRGFIVRFGDGIGEATPLTPWTESYDACERALTHIVETEAPPGAALGTLTETPAARHGVALAVLDAHARRRNQPLMRYLGGDATVATIPVNATLDAADAAALATAASDAAAAGYPAVKVKIGRAELATDLERVAAVRAAIGANVELRLDANAAWDAQTAIEAAPVLAEHDISYLEQPTPGIDRDLIDRLEAEGVPVAIDEGLDRSSIADAISAGVSAIILKPMALGGPDIARAAAMTALACGVTPVVSDLVTGAVSRTAAAHVAASLSAPVPAGLDTGRRLAGDLIDRPPTVESGAFVIPDGNGLGIDTEAVGR